MWNISKFFAKSKIYKKFKYFAKNLLKPKKNKMLLLKFLIKQKIKERNKSFPLDVMKLYENFWICLLKV